MVGDCIIPPPDLSPKIRSRSGFPAGFKFLILPLILISACAGTDPGVKRHAGVADASKIINVRFINSIGPSIGDRIVLMDPSDLVVNKIGEIFISDRGLNLIIKLSNEFDMMSYEGGIGSGLGDFNRPSGLDCDAALNVYIADPGNRRIQILDRNLRQAAAITEYFDQEGLSRKFNNPEDVAIDFEGNIWVTDDDRVLKLNPFNELELELSYTSRVGLNIGRAASIAATGTGIIAIGDSGNKKIFIISSYGNLISDFEVGSLSSVTWEGKDIIWVTSRVTGKISSYDIYGNLLYAFADERPGAKPASVAINTSGRLTVADGGLKIISRYEILRSEAAPSEK